MIRGLVTFSILLIIAGCDSIFSFNDESSDFYYYIAYADDPEEGSEHNFFKMDSDAGESEGWFIRPLPRLSVWSPDGSKIALAAGFSALFFAELENLESEMISSAFGQFGWLEDNESIVYSVGDTIYRVSIYESSAEVFSNGSFPAIAPDDNLIAYNKDHELHIRYVSGNHLIYVADSAGSYKKWSPDGNYLAFTQNENLGIFDVDQQEVRILTESDNLVTSPILANISWSPEGDRIAYIESCGEKSECLNILEIAPSETSKILEKEAITSIAWSPDPSEDIIYFGTTSPGRIIKTDSEAENLEVVTETTSSGAFSVSPLRKREP